MAIFCVGIAVGAMRPASGSDLPFRPSDDRVFDGSREGAVGPPPVVYRFIGARTSTSNVLTSVHCTTLGNVTPPSPVDVVFRDFDGSVVGQVSFSLGGPNQTVVVTAHIANVTADVALFEEDFLVPLSSDLNQGVVEVASAEARFVCSAQNIDATTSAIQFAEALHGFRLVPPLTTVRAMVFTGVRVLPAFVDTSLQCTNLDPVHNEPITVHLFERDGTLVDTIGPLVIPSGATRTISTADTAYLANEMVANVNGQIEEGSMVIGLNESNQHIYCTAQLVPTFTVPPAFVLKLGSIRVWP